MLDFLILIVDNDVIRNKLEKEKEKKMRITIKDQKRWSNHVQKIYKVLKDQNWHNRDELFEYTQSKALGARISELRKKGYIIKCVRSGIGGQTIYRLFGEVDYDTTVKKHCNCCKYKKGEINV